LSEAMKATLRGLLELRKVDEKLSHLNRRMSDGPRIFDKRRTEFEQEHAAIEQKRDEIAHIKVGINDKEVDMQGKEEEIVKQETYLLGAKTNKEYSAIQDTIKRLKEEIGVLEEGILEQFEEVEESSKALVELERDYGIEEDDLNEFKKTIDKDTAEYALEVKEFEGKRGNLLDILDFEAVNLYDRVKSARDGDVVVGVNGNTCGGCYMTVTANDLARLRGLKELVTCKSCQRILYIPELLD
jgi:predicted  nucleic acid-binding Zn-ribbon protein